MSIFQIILLIPVSIIAITGLVGVVVVFWPLGLSIYIGVLAGSGAVTYNEKAMWVAFGIFIGLILNFVYMALLEVLCS